MRATTSQYETSTKNNAGADLAGGCRGCALPAPPRDDLQFSNTTGILQKKSMWFTGVEVEQETSAPPPKKNPGSAPVMHIRRNLQSIIYPLDKKFIGTSSILIFHSWSARPPIWLFFEYNSQCPLLVLYLFPPHHQMFQWLWLLPYPRDGLLPYLNLPSVHRLVRRGIWYFQFSSKKWKHMWCALVLFGFDLCHLQTTCVSITHLLWS